MADLLNDTMSNEGAQPQTQPPTTSQATTDRYNGNDDDMEVTLTRVSESQPPVTAQNPGQGSTPAAVNNDKTCTQADENTDVKQPCLINSESVEMVTSSLQTVSSHQLGLPGLGSLGGLPIKASPLGGTQHPVDPLGLILGLALKLLLLL